jgi:hypothetical protein
LVSILFISMMHGQANIKFTIEMSKDVNEQVPTKFRQD